MRKKIVLKLLCLFISITSFAQTNSELLRLAEEAFNAQNFLVSATYYKQIIVNIDSGTLESTLPYGVAPYNKPFKKQKKKSAFLLGKDSSTTSTNKQVKSDSTDVTKSDMNPQKRYAMEQLALSYQLLHSYNNAEIAYKKLYDNNALNYAYDYAKILQMNGKYKEAIEIANNLLVEQELGTAPFNKTRDLVKSCSFAIQAIANKNQIIEIKPIDIPSSDPLNQLQQVNSTGGSFAANFAGDNSIVFSSSRIPSEEQPANSDIYKVALDSKRKPVNGAQNISQLINTENNEGAAVLSPDKTKIYFTKWNYDVANPECAIYVSKYLNGQWLTPRKLKDNLNTPGYRTMHPSLSPDGTTLYFVSDRPGGLGKLDIWYTALDEQDNVSEIKNPGPSINTTENDVTPFLHPNNVLYFSSDGHPGLGGLDIYKVSLDRGFGITPKNLGSPINSNHDDSYYISDETAQVGFISSDRESCVACGEANCYKIYYFEDKPIIITISGRVFNETTLEPVVNSMIEFIDIKENYDPIFVFTDEKGEYKTKLNREAEYFSTAQKKGFFKDAVAVSTMNINKSTDIIQNYNFSLKSIPSGDIVIQGIEYDYNKATLRPNSKIKLDSLIDFLSLNDNLIVEISSHTDVRGSDIYNLKLSEARAKTTVDYLVEHGIEKERLVAKGYGETTPLIIDATTEEEHQKNRRTAFRMLSEDFKPVDKFKYIRSKQIKSKEPAQFKAQPQQRREVIE